MYKISVLTTWNIAFGAMPKQPEYKCPKCGKTYKYGEDGVEPVYIRSERNIKFSRRKNEEF